jgi:lipopolysaccharide assembly protein A
MTDEKPSELPDRPLAAVPGKPVGVPLAGATPSAREPVTGRRGKGRSRAPRTRVSAAFVGAVAGLLVLVALLVFILQNTETVKVNFLGASGRLGLGLALLVAAVAGALVVAILGIARIAQLRKLGKR